MSISSTIKRLLGWREDERMPKSSDEDDFMLWIGSIGARSKLSAAGYLPPDNCIRISAELAAKLATTKSLFVLFGVAKTATPLDADVSSMPVLGTKLLAVLMWDDYYLCITTKDEEEFRQLLHAAQPTTK